MLSPGNLLAGSIVAHTKEGYMSIVAETAASVIPAGTWSIDPVHSTVEFHVTYAGVATVKGRALIIAGTIRGGEEPAIEGRGTFRGETLDAYGNERVGLDLAGVVDRTEFGVDWNAPLPGGGYLLP